jgi:hypothetical protein
MRNATCARMTQSLAEKDVAALRNETSAAQSI